MRFFDTKSEFKGHNSCVMCTHSIDSEYIATGSLDKAVRIWSLKTMQCVRYMQGHSDCVTGLTSLKGDRLISSSDDKTLIMWSLYSDVAIQKFSDHKDSVSCVTSFNKVNNSNYVLKLGGERVSIYQVFFSGSWDKTIKIWNTKYCKPIATLVGHTSPIKCMCLLELKNNIFSKDKNLDLSFLSATGISENNERLGFRDTTKEKGKHFGSQKNILSIKIEGQTKNPITYYAPNTARNLPRASPFEHLEDYYLMQSFNYDLYSKESPLRKSAATNRIDSFSPVKRDLTMHLPNLDDQEKFEENFILISGGNYQEIIIWNVSRLEIIKKLEGHAAAISSLGMWKGKKLISSSLDRSVNVWNEKFDTFDKINAGAGFINSFCIKNNYLIFSTGYNLIELWDLTTQKMILKVQVDQKTVFGVFSLEGDKVAINVGNEVKIFRIINTKTLLLYLLKTKTTLNNYLIKVTYKFIVE